MPDGIVGSLNPLARGVPHSGSGVAPMSSLSGVELLGFWEFGVGGLTGEGRGK
jgi:hypothetical protein